MTLCFLQTMFSAIFTRWMDISVEAKPKVFLTKIYLLQRKLDKNITQSMQEKESIMVVRCELKIPSLGITVRHHSASLVLPNSYPRDGIFSLHLTTIKDSYNTLPKAWACVLKANGWMSKFSLNLHAVSMYTKKRNKTLGQLHVSIPRRVSMHQCHCF